MFPTFSFRHHRINPPRATLILGALIVTLGSGACAQTTPRAGQAAQHNQTLQIASWSVTPPPAGGQFATVNYTWSNSGTSAVALPDVTPVLVGADGKEEAFDVVPLGSPAPGATLAPGARITLRRFKKVEAGNYTVGLRLQNGANRVVLADASGRATLPLRVLAPALVPQPVFEMQDARASHLYQTGETIEVQVAPFFMDGDDLTPEVAAFTAKPLAKPFSISDDAKLQSLLKSDSPTPEGFIADFYGLDKAQRVLEVGATFRQPVALSSLRLGGVHLNGEYGLENPVMEVTRPDGSTVSVAANLSVAGNNWTLTGVLSPAMKVSGWRVRLPTPYKINVTSLRMRGQITGAAPTPATVSSWWEDAGGRRLTSPRPLILGQKTRLASPPKLAPGYYGLVLATRTPRGEVLRSDYGFAVLPPSTLATQARVNGLRGDARLGVVHSDLRDATLGTGLSKSLAAINFYDVAAQKLNTQAWRDVLAERRGLGLRDLPIVYGELWQSDSTKAIGDEQLQKLKTMMRQFFAADPDVLYWELGLEENLPLRNNREAWKFYYPNLAAKARVIREAAQEVNPKAKLIYQVAELDIPAMEAFFQSEAPRYFDILSSHPYAWPDFQSPQKWMPPFLKQVRAIMAAHKATMPIWFTEGGAPLDGNPGGFFGYPGPQAFVRGLSRSEHAAYLVQFHAVALHQGVEKVFWYNYRDGGFNPEFAEDFFGMIDFRGFPKPTYAAYATMSHLLRDKAPVESAPIPNLAVYRFRGNGQECVVAWAPGAVQRVNLNQLSSSANRRVFSTTGTPLSPAQGILSLGNDPVFVVSPLGK